MRSNTSSKGSAGTDCALYYLDLTTGRQCDELLEVKWACKDMDIGELEIVETVVPVNTSRRGPCQRRMQVSGPSRLIRVRSRLFVTIAVPARGALRIWA